ncbi:DUF2550 family protein [Cellulomonas sp. JZ18]|uniref:DUF2550 family protein n=1 Tax=Cellulomonas sp. JZ18 TaxID=2654191 RepID=UPI0012D4731F|nr:DUF2550 family protein [Cellulomonas sp. JZ18]QGQ19997.1 DUF2550 family protein [Cellulomonas sp. JZ18]
MGRGRGRRPPARPGGPALGSRTASLGRRVGSFDCALADRRDGPWVRGVAQYGATRLYWWRRVSLLPRPARVWTRAGITVVERHVVTVDDVPTGVVLARCRVVPERHDSVHEVHLRMSAEAYAGFTSWIEATPSRVGTVI